MSRTDVNVVLFATYTVKKGGVRLRTSGPVQPFIDFFVPRFPEVHILEQPLPESEDLLPTLETYRNGTLAERRTLPRWLRPWWHVSRRRQARSGTILRLKFRDILSLLWASSTASGRPIDLLVGMESVNAALGVWLRRAGRARKVVYYLFDFTPRRYGAPLMNRAYLALDRWCCRRCDLVWNISEAYARARIDELGYDPRLLAPQVTVNYGVDVEKIDLPAEDEIDPDRLVFAGTVNFENGIEILMQAFPLIRRRAPAAVLWILGGGRQLERVREWARDPELAGSVRVLGMVSDPAELTGILARSAVALAPYPDYPQSTKRYGDVMKIRDYLACGLPVVTTAVPPVARAIAEEPAGAVSRADPGDFAAAALSLLDDPPLRRRCRENALRLARANTWARNFSRGLAPLGLDSLA
ncbi:MAG TPA: glycosyltransferase [bacterium]|nr:glycosyltransferase [bacterium]HPQ66919.1 glycosyltransferase [bacterium]